MPRNDFVNKFFYVVYSDRMTFVVRIVFKTLPGT